MVSEDGDECSKSESYDVRPSNAESKGGRSDAGIAMSRSTRATPKKSELESLAGASINASSSKGQEKQGTRSALAMVNRAKTPDRSEPREVVEPTKGKAEYWIWKSPSEPAMSGDPQGHARNQIGIMLRKEVPPEQRRKLNAHIELLSIAKHFALGFWEHQDPTEKLVKIDLMQRSIDVWPPAVAVHLIRCAVEVLLDSASACEDGHAKLIDEALEATRPFARREQQQIDPARPRV